MRIELRESDGSIAPHILLALAQIIALLSPQFPFRRHVFTAILIALFAASRLRPHFSNNPAIVQTFVLGWSTFLSAFERMYSLEKKGQRITSGALTGLPTKPHNSAPSGRRS
ncbi:hypothetical protein K458DRAFT_397757 [Lentithecium fluviatile CBS 122367]|uniref:Uncharacterized protein n=1 Tax=Lentithecium fluviatile CBS 122367 TaxID=1168545 RepID=A0A6G1IBZ8_9PLEO|nr:hypothetical protein K458DRAFT_397757 [Lentithecium fluviatile CBS 122367]